MSPQSNSTSAGINYYNFNAPNTDADNQGIMRIDYQLTSKDMLWGSAIFDSNSATNTLPLPSTSSTGTGATLPGFAANNSSHVKVFNASWTHMFNGTTLNELRAGYFRFNYAELEPAASTLAPPSSFGFDIVPQDAAVGTLPFMNVNGYFALGFSTNGPQPRIDQNYIYFDNFSKVVGTHNLKFGVSVERIAMSNPSIRTIVALSTSYLRLLIALGTRRQISCLVFQPHTIKGRVSMSMSGPGNTTDMVRTTGRCPLQ
jgi:hypothetical protein